MKKLNRKQIYITILIIILSLSLIISAYFLIDKGYSKTQFKCDVVVAKTLEPKLFDLNIESNYEIKSISCDVKKGCIDLPVLNYLSFGVFDKGQVEMTFNDVSISKGYSIFTLGGEDKVSLTMCSDVGVGTIRLIEPTGFVSSDYEVRG